MYTAKKAKNSQKQLSNEFKTCRNVIYIKEKKECNLNCNLGLK